MSNGDKGNVTKSQWHNTDFGGNSGYDATFWRANLSESMIKGCDLSGIDFSETIIDDIKIIDPVSTLELKINQNQIEIVSRAIQFTDQERQAEYLNQIRKHGAKKTLSEYLKIAILEIKN